MGDSGAEDTSDSLTDADLDQIASDAEAIQEGPKSNIVGSSSYDAQFTADNLEARGLDPSNFMSASNFAQTTQGGFTGGTGPQETTINVPSVQAADTTPTFAQSASIFDPDLETMTGRRDTAPRGLETGVMAPEQRGTPSFDAFGNPVTVQSFLPAAVTVDRTAPQTQQQRGLAALAQTLNQARDKGVGMGDERGIDFGVTAPVGSSVGDDFGPALDMTDARTTNQILADQSRMQQGQIPSTTATSTTATGAEDPFDPDVGKPFDVERLEQMERLQEPTFLERAGIPSVLSAVDPERISRDRMATAIALGRPLGLVEGFNFTAPDMTKDKETIEEYNKRISARIPESQLVKDDSGLVIGIKDASGRLVEGRDPSAQMQGDDSPDPQKKVPPKQPTDPCPEGFQLIDGKCTPVGGTETDTGFVVFPPSRDPAFQRGPFTPATVASNPGIRGLNPITFNIPQNIFRR